MFVKELTKAIVETHYCQDRVLVANTKQKPGDTAVKPSEFSRRHVHIVVAIVGLTLAIAGAWWIFHPVAVPAARPRNVLLITIDTLRADALGAYGNAAAVTPWLDRLAAGGLRFENARAHNVVTLPSHANILTGRLPADHGVRDNAGFRVAPGDETLATRLKAHGFQTGAFVSAFPLDSRFGLARGFDIYDDRFVDATPRPAVLEQERAATATIAAARRWLQSAAPSAPWFCWVHLYEPHFPYSPPEPFASRSANAPYAGEVAATDAALGPLLQPILDAGASTDTLVVVTSDHGESLGEHDEATHGIFAYEGTLRVPLIVYYPSRVEARVVSSAAGHIDLLPTILHLLELPAIPGIRGRNLIDAARAQPVGREVTYFEALSGSLNWGWAPLTGVVVDGLKYIDLPIPELYDLRHDAGERRNLAAERPQEVASLREALETFERANIRRTPETADVKERLRGLGYVTSQNPGHRTPYTEEDDPKRLIRFEAKLQDIVGLYLSGNIRDALERCRALVNERPAMRVALLQLGHLEREAGNLSAAIDALRRTLDINPRDEEAASLLGAYLTAANRSAEAVDVLQPFVAGPNADLQVLMALALAQARTNRVNDAIATLHRARAQDPASALVEVHLGTVQLMAGRRQEARQAFQAALNLNADVARAHTSLAMMATEDGRREEALAHWRKAVALDSGEYEKLLAIGVALAKGGRSAEARLYLQLFAEGAPPERHAADIARVRRWLGEKL
jgi:arylsulfatase A-like enzyme/Flp pilus assembly protein TadD